MTADLTWDDLAGSLPTHDDTLLAASEGAPSIEEQSRTHGAPLPDEDHG